MKFILIMAAIFLPAIGHAQPRIDPNGVTGEVQHGSTMVIRGNSFGVKETAAPLRWETFSGATVGQTPYEAAGNTFWSNQDDPRSGTGMNAAVAADSLRHGNVLRHVKLSYPHDDFGGAYFNHIEESDVMYMNFWVLWKYAMPDTYANGPQSGDNHWQVKYGRLTTLDTSSADENTIGYEVYPGLTAFAQLRYEDFYRTEWLYHGYDEFCNGRSRAPQNYMAMPPPDDTPRWINVAMALKQGDIHHVKFNTWMSNANPGSAINSAGGIIDDIADTTCASGGLRVNMFKIGGSCENGGNAVNLYYSEIYLDTSWARVEIGDKPVYSQCTHREIQIPTAWATDEITINFNLGSFSTEESLYLFVVDSDDTASDGYQIAVGDAGAPGPGEPGQPKP